MKNNVLVQLRFTKEELDFLSSLIEAQKYKLIFSKENSLKSSQSLDLANRIENKLGYVLGY